ncbi:MAG: hypothetical protein L0Y72_22200 [Gemmataceae bacterium]|nr:hypothetical protein [Gemmataceae bacterium]
MVDSGNRPAASPKLAAADFGEEDEETVLEVLDALRGWRHPAAELLPEKPVR